MSSEVLNNKVNRATLWATIGEFAAKLISPITSMVLSHLLTPEDFGIVAAVNIIISFADILTDAGFQKYLIQHDYKTDDELKVSANVAFSVNILLSAFFWMLIIIFRYSLARQIGCENNANALIVAGVSLIVTAFSSIQMAIYRRQFDFKTLFQARILGSIVNLSIAAPIAYLTLSFWAIIFGTLTSNFCTTAYLTMKSIWKPKLVYDLKIFKEMFTFTSWTLLEQVTIWISTYLGVFIVGRYLSSYYLGIFNNSMTTVNQFTTILSSAFSPVLFTALSRLKNDRIEYLRMYLKYKRLIACFTVPLCVGIFAYKELIVAILLGEQWYEACDFIGLWAISGAFVLIGQYTSEIYRSLGKPQLSTIVQFGFIIVSIPTLLLGAKNGFNVVCIVQVGLRFILILFHIFVLVAILKFPYYKMVVNVIPCYIASACMLMASYSMRIFSDGYVWQFCTIPISALIYFMVLSLFKQYREELIIGILKKCQTVLMGSR